MKTEAGDIESMYGLENRRLSWCQNDLDIIGPTLQLEDFLRFAEGDGPFDFNKILPYPESYARLDAIAEAWYSVPRGITEEEYLSRPKHGYFTGGREWCIEHWGTSRTAFNFEEVEKFENYLGKGKSLAVFRFVTASNPPKPVVAKAAELYPTLTYDLRYFESSAGFHGMYYLEDGVCLEDKSGPYYGNRGG